MMIGRFRSFPLIHIALWLMAGVYIMTLSSEPPSKPRKRSKSTKLSIISPNTLNPVSKPRQRKKENPENHELLVETFSSKWHSVSALHELERTTGLTYKRGKFSNTEAKITNEAVVKFLKDQNMAFQEFNSNFFEKRGHGRLADFFVQVAQQLNGRPVIHVYHYLRRQYHPGNYKGFWTPVEDDQLKRLFAIHGPKWEVIGDHLDRFHISCKDRYRKIRETFNAGKWTDEEVGKLRDAILAWRSERPTDCAVWVWISEKVATRSWLQCASKWASSLDSHLRRDPTGRNIHERLEWTDDDDLLLIHRIYDLAVEDESEIIWRHLNTDGLDKWSGMALSIRWSLLKKRVAGYRQLDMDTILETLMNALKNDNILNMEPAEEAKLDVSDLQ